MIEPQNNLVVLEITVDGSRVSTYELAPGEKRAIGRGTNSEIVIDDGYLSSRHLEVHNVDGVAIVRDLKSTNGTFIGVSRLTADTEVVLKAETEIKAGRTSIRIHFTGAGPSSKVSFQKEDVPDDTSEKLPKREIQKETPLPIATPPMESQIENAGDAEESAPFSSFSFEKDLDFQPQPFSSKPTAQVVTSEEPVEPDIIWDDFIPLPSDDHPKRVQDSETLFRLHRAPQDVEPYYQKLRYTGNTYIVARLRTLGLDLENCPTRISLFQEVVDPLCVLPCAISLANWQAYVGPLVVGQVLSQNNVVLIGLRSESDPRSSLAELWDREIRIPPHPQQLFDWYHPRAIDQLCSLPEDSVIAWMGTEIQAVLSLGYDGIRGLIRPNAKGWEGLL